MSAEEVRRAVDTVNIAVGGTATAAVWLADLEITLRIGVSALTCVYLGIAIWHRLRPRPIPVEADESQDDTQ